MRHDRRVKAAPDRHPTLTVYKPEGRFLTPFLALGLIGTILAANTGPAHAQKTADSAGGEVVLVDVSDPSITIDLSVLNDDGLTPHRPMFKSQAQPSTFKSAGPARQALNFAGAKAPARMPVSTLYIQPSHTLQLPTQTKPLRVKPVVKPVSAPRMVANTPVQAPAIPAIPMPKTPIVAAVAPPPPPPMATVAPVAPGAAPTLKTKVETPAPTPTPKPAPIKEVVQADPAPMPIAAPEPAPVPVPAAPVIAQPTGTPHPPLALPHAPAHTLQTAQALPPVPTPAPVAKTKAKVASSGSALVMNLPPHDGAARPGVASLPPTDRPLGDGDRMRIVFAQDSSKLPSEARAALKTMSERMLTQDNLRLQLLAYAGDTDTSASAARRLSLSRALAVRSFLIESGVRSTRIDVRALGNKSTNAVTERVDITVVER